MDYQETVNALWPQDIYYVDCHLSVLANTERPWIGPFCYYVSDELTDFFSCPQKHPRRALRECAGDLLFYLTENRNIWDGAYFRNVGTYSLALDILARHKPGSFGQLIRNLQYKGLRQYLWVNYMRLPDWAKAPHRAVKKLFKH